MSVASENTLLKVDCNGFETNTHSHEWRSDPSRWTRLHGDAYENPVQCICGATAWKYQWCDKHSVTGVNEPESYCDRD